MSEAARELLTRAPIVDLAVGSVLFRDSFVRGGRGHVDLPRMERAGVRLIGLTVATTWPDLRGSLSRWHFRSLGLPPRAVGSPMAIAEWLIGRIHRWCAESGGRLVVVRTRDDLARTLVDGGPVGVLIGVQGGHVLEGSLDNLARLRDLGVRMFAPAHVMDNALVGSSTGRFRGGLTAFGREALAALDEQSVVVDLAHMSVVGIEDSLAVLSKPFTLSHTGLTDVAHGRSRWRRYSAANRNISASLAREVGEQGGLLGICLSTQLLGGTTLDAAVRTISLALESAGDYQVAIGSDMDGALETLIDVDGYPALADALLRSTTTASSAGCVIGTNAIRLLERALPSP